MNPFMKHKARDTGLGIIIPVYTQCITYNTNHPKNFPIFVPLKNSLGFKKFLGFVHLLKLKTDEIFTFQKELINMNLIIKPIINEASICIIDEKRRMGLYRLRRWELLMKGAAG